MCQAVLTVVTGLTVRLSEAQVNHQIYSKTDLMATDSLRSGLGVTVRPPPGFLSNLRQQPAFLPTPLPSQDLPRLATTERVERERNTKINNKRNNDGSYSFRSVTWAGCDKVTLRHCDTMTLWYCDIVTL